METPTILDQQLNGLIADLQLENILHILAANENDNDKGQRF